MSLLSVEFLFIRGSLVEKDGGTPGRIRTCDLRISDLRLAFTR